MDSRLTTTAPSGLSDPIVPAAGSRAAWFTVALAIVTFVGDGWSGRPLGVRHQLLLLPFTGLFLFSLWKLLFSPGTVKAGWWTIKNALIVCALLELVSLGLFAYEAHHFAFLGYGVRSGTAFAFLFVVAFLVVLVAVRGATPKRLLMLFIGLYGFGVLFAILSFPLNYLRSDMLPVIVWADRNLLRHVSPYATMFVDSRVYDFPYLPGMLVAYLPFIAAGLDPRFASIVTLDLAATLAFRAALPEHRRKTVCLLGIFLLCPFLQFRHDLYLQPHWLTLFGAFLLMQRRHFVWAAFVLGLGMAIYQFSWIILPFVLLNALWRRGWLESMKLVLAAAAGALLLVAPFLRSAFAKISSNTVGQWGRFAHALADPMNFSYWITYAIHPDKLLRLQAILMVALFIGCVVTRRCRSVEDTLRWTIVALTVFILCNSIVDGYFYLMLLVPMLLFTLIANGWLASPPEQGTAST